MNYKVPYDFILKELYPVRAQVIKMLGGYGLRLQNKLIMFLREKETEIEFNGVFIATHPEHYRALQDEIHCSKMDFDLDGMKDSWIFISEDLNDFEEKVKKACEMIKQGDSRIGK